MLELTRCFPFPVDTLVPDTSSYSTLFNSFSVHSRETAGTPAKMVSGLAIVTYFQWNHGGESLSFVYAHMELLCIKI